VLLTGGCAHRAALIAPALAAPAQSPVELTQTPFFPQRDYQCGPAALATVLVASGVEVTADELVGRVYLPGRKGSLQPELLATSRSFDRLPYVLEPALAALLTEVAAGNPVLVLQNYGLASVPFWHYAVVIGYDAARDHLVLRSGTDERLEMSARRFMDTWERAEQWAIAVVQPGNLPASAERTRYLEAAAGLEATRRLDAAARAYEAALRRWPDDTTAWLGIGNVKYTSGDLAAAAAAYREVLRIDATHAVARNNLAQTLLDQGDAHAALDEIVAARASLTDERLAPLLEQTEQAIRQSLAGTIPESDPPSTGGRGDQKPPQ
jgi:tetratricopeptide (TPR) repeat protein